ncbi:MAG: hypothetical protein DME22_18620 [Verrucomicrobia bacterium]|nr:MAG: hypothetical protein DME22_18620 [Verrucomicrobiota bacterium]PYJ96031.1 MAG: hypothetical protein DME23_21885 [Verrucomicrobiota bacterium]
MSRLDRICDWAERANLAHFDASELAKLCLVSPSQLRRYFTSAFGITPQDWLNELRLCHAAHLICSSSLSVKEIARELHFRDESSFCHQFKRLFGCKSSEFALRYRLPGEKDLAQLPPPLTPVAQGKVPTAPAWLVRASVLRQKTGTASIVRLKRRVLPRRIHRAVESPEGKPNRHAE